MLSPAIPDEHRPPPDARTRLGQVAFWAWVPCALVVGSFLMVGHILTLPKPSVGDAPLAAAVKRERAPEERGRWLATHVLYADCGCSRLVLDHLLERRAAPGVVEKIVFVVGEDPTAALSVGERARTAGFVFVALAPEELVTRYHVESAPLLVVADPGGAVRYVGGYTDRKRGPVIEDQAILARLREGVPVAELPVFGCAISKQLQRTLDPLRLKY